MWIISGIINKRKQKQLEKNEECLQLSLQNKAVLQEVYEQLNQKKELIDLQFFERWQRDHKHLIVQMQGLKLSYYQNCETYCELETTHRELLDLSLSLRQKIINHNEQIIQQNMNDYYQVVGAVEGEKLDEKQMSAVVKNAHNQLIIAGAGCGKTTTILGKIKYLLNSGQCMASDILALSFTNASARELRQRIEKETGKTVDACTFHKLGLDIITMAEGIRPRISTLNLAQFLQKSMMKEMQNSRYMRKIMYYVYHADCREKSEFEFDSRQSWENYLKTNPPMTYCKERVKSYGEMDIANFLFQNGIRYEYERPYEKDTRTQEHSQYHPDFYLPDYHLYIEYYGIDRNGQPPKYFEKGYVESMQWKRELHRENKTKCLEFYAYEKMEGSLNEALKNRLNEAGVRFQPLSVDEMWGMIRQQEGGKIFEKLTEQFLTLINLIKSNAYTIEQVRNLVVDQGGNDLKINLCLLDLLDPLYFLYNEELNRRGEIDFNDMIQKAADYINKGKRFKPYKEVIIDEYQDISKARYELIKALRSQSDFNLFCVGDDWQSIYRFAGSDVDYIIHFEEYWGITDIIKIDTTYRFTKSMIDVSSFFIQKNPFQIKKRLHTHRADRIFSLSFLKCYSEKTIARTIADELYGLPQNSTVFFLGRYKNDVKVLMNDNDFSLRFQNQTQKISVICSLRPDLNITFMSIHQSKGLQADYVFLLNNKSSAMGFPSNIKDPSLISLLLRNSDTYPFAEERRLFYVALTRSRFQTYLVVIRHQESCFAKELEEHFHEQLTQSRAQCPLCNGTLIKRRGKYGVFYGCSNYRKGCTFTRKISTGHHHPS